MRDESRCPKCAHDEILFIPETGHFGLFELYVCRGCGYSEMYAIDVESIPVKKLTGAKILGDRTAYRGARKR